MSYTTLIILEKYFFFLPRVSVTCTVIGSFSKYDDDDNDSVKKNNWFYEQDKYSAASRFLEHFFDVHCTTTTWNLPMRRFMENVDIRRQIFLSLFEKNLNPGKVAYIWQIERVQIDAIKFERTQIHFSVMFLLLSLLLKHPNDAVNEKATWS